MILTHYGIFGLRPPASLRAFRCASNAFERI
jgi:hypothetical protein